jgi:predicted component of type VI protein secretion system
MKKDPAFVVDLIIRSGAQAGRIVKIRRLPFMIGTDVRCQLRPFNGSVSARHCVIQSGIGGLAITDFASATGTRVNGVRIVAATPIGDGDEIHVGPLAFEVRVISTQRAVQPHVVENLKPPA